MSEWTEDHAYAIAAADAQARAKQRELRTLVADARAAGMPWSMIGAALGVSKQAAQQRYGSVRS